MTDPEPTPEEIDMSIAAIEGYADEWAANVNLNAMIENIAGVLRLNKSVPDDVRASFAKRMKEMIDALVRQAFIEGMIRAIDGPTSAEWDHD